VPCFGRQHPQIDAEFLQGSIVFGAGIDSEYEFGIGGAVQPAIALDLGLKLAGRPAGIAERQNGARRPLAARDRLQNVDGRGEANPIVDRQRR
jgi:hypothetical protein